MYLFFSNKPVVHTSRSWRHSSRLCSLWFCMWWHTSVSVWWNGGIRKVQQWPLWVTGEKVNSNHCYVTKIWNTLDLQSDYALSSWLISNMFDILSHLLEHTLAAFPVSGQFTVWGRNWFIIYVMLKRMYAVHHLKNLSRTCMIIII